MDSISQAVLGGCIQGSILSKHQGRKAYLYGALLGTLPDLDVFIPYANPIDAMTHHRSFSHSLFVLSALAILIVFLIKRFNRAPNIPTTRLFMAVWLALITHPLLDAFTSYGTQLFWPIDVTPTSWASIFIVDFAFTLPLLAAFILGIFKKHNPFGRTLSILTLCWGCLYLGLGQLSQTQALSKAEKQMSKTDINLTRFKAMATPANIILWRILAEDTQNRRYEIMCHTLDSKPCEYRSLPQSVSPIRFETNANIKQLNWFTDNWVNLSIQNEQLILEDMRMANSGEYFFRFVLAKRQQNQWQYVLPIQFRNNRNYSIKEHLSMLWLRLTQGRIMPYAKWHTPKKL